MTGHRLARLSLRIDGVYCVAVGVVVAAIAPTAPGSLSLSPLLVAAIGVATILWGGYVWFAGGARSLRVHTRAIMIANIVASAALAATGILASTAVLSLAAGVLAIDVAAFAVSQGWALYRPPHQNRMPTTDTEA